jgi:hypothetical protein
MTPRVENERRGQRNEDKEWGELHWGTEKCRIGNKGPCKLEKKETPGC